MPEFLGFCILFYVGCRLLWAHITMNDSTVNGQNIGKWRKK